MSRPAKPTAIDSQVPAECDAEEVAAVDPEGDFIPKAIANNIEQRFLSLRQAAQAVVDARGVNEKAEAISQLERWQNITAPA